MFNKGLTKILFYFNFLHSFGLIQGVILRQCPLNANLNLKLLHKKPNARTQLQGTIQKIFQWMCQKKIAFSKLV